MCGKLAKDFHKLMKSIASFSNNQANVAHYEENLDAIRVEIVPNDGLYYGGRFEFEIKANDYPKNAPNVICITQIYHPNIDDQGEICLNLFSEWAETNTLEDCVHGLLFLLYNPNLEDPLNPLFDPEVDTDFEVFAKNVRLSLEGGVIEGCDFERNLVHEDSSTDENTTGDQVQEDLQAKECKEAVETVDDDGLIEIQVVDDEIDSSEEVPSTTNTGGTDHATECHMDANVTKKSEETTDCISGKINSQRTEEEPVVLVEIERRANHLEEHG